VNLANLTIGTYYPGNSFIHRLDGRIKIICVLLFSLTLFLVSSFYAFIFIALFFVFVFYLSDLTLSWLFKAIRPVLYILILSFILQIFFSSGSPIGKGILLSRITLEGLNQGMLVVCRISLLVCFASIMTFTTTSVAMADSFELLLSPLAIIRFPSHEIAMVMTIALRYIPELLVQAQKIIKAQKARGADFESKNIFLRAKSLLPIVIPLFVIAYQRADELGMAMEARGYRGGEGRTRYKESVLKTKDIASLVSVVLICGLALFIK